MNKAGDIDDRLERAEWLMRPETQRILALLDGAAGRTRVVGGIVRDTLLELPRGIPTSTWRPNCCPRK